MGCAMPGVPVPEAEAGGAEDTVLLVRWPCWLPHIDSQSSAEILGIVQVSEQSRRRAMARC